MATVAAPKYLTDLGQNFYKECPPGHRFTLYFDAWNSQWKIDKDEKTKAVLRAACKKSLPETTKEQLKSFLERQAILATAAGCEALLTISTAHFATGLGLEHPIENGFAFLNPYGLPYLAGSSIKGVLRRAANELASGMWGETKGWKEEYIVDLFGSKPEIEPITRGALSFWDVLPDIRETGMDVDILTPHQGKYYTGDESPHDSGQPIPNSFLVVPANVKYAFYYQCNENFLTDDALTNGGWKILMKEAFHHAFEWLGFGAKTAVGYGAFELPDEEKRARQEQEKREAEVLQKKIEAEKQSARIQRWENAEITFDKGRQIYSCKHTNGSIVANAKKSKDIKDAASEAWLKKLDKQKVIKATALVDVEGNSKMLVEIEE